MSPIVKENETLIAAPGSAHEAPAKPQPVALEIQVTVNGARTVEGSDKREPFSESTKTVLVFGNGAVIRLASSVASGQLLFLTNEKTKKEVVCQVVKSKNYSSVSGYVELEFTEPILGFWGMRFPNDRLGPQSVSPASHAVPAAAQSQPLAPASPRAPLAPPSAPLPAASVATKVVAPLPASVAPAAPRNHAPSLAPVPEKSPASAPQPPVPVIAAKPAAAKPESLSQLNQNWQDIFKSSSTVAPPNADAASQRRVSDPQSAPNSAVVDQKAAQPPSRPAEDLPKFDVAALNNQLQDILAIPPSRSPQPPAENAAPKVSAIAAPPKVVPISQPKPAPLLDAEKPAPAPLRKPEPAPLPPKNSSLQGTLADVEESKIPAWLEPLSRNSAAPSSTHELLEREKSRRLAEQAHREEPEKSSPVSAAPVPHLSTAQLADIPAPTFGNTLRIDENSETPASSGSRKGLLIAVIAACLALIAAGAWYLRTSSAVSNTPAPSVATSAVAQPSNNPASVSVPSNAAPASGSQSAVAPVVAPVVSNSFNASGSNVAANTSPRNSAPATISVSSVTPVPVSHPIESAPVAPATRASLGQVRLAAPTVNRASGSQENLEAGAGLEAAPSLGGNDALGSSLSSAGPRQPASQPALPVGGIVRPAKLITAVPPVYPSIAKSQHIAGNVLIDALIDASGHVNTMKVISGPTLLHQAAMDSLRQWKYQPETLDGKPVAMHLTVTVQFRLQ